MDPIIDVIVFKTPMVSQVGRDPILGIVGYKHLKQALSGITFIVITSSSNCTSINQGISISTHTSLTNILVRMLSVPSKTTLAFFKISSTLVWFKSFTIASTSISQLILRNLLVAAIALGSPTSFSSKSICLL